VQKGLIAIPRSSSAEHRAENLQALEGDDLSAEDIVALDALDQNHPYYWWLEASDATL